MPDNNKKNTGAIVKARALALQQATSNLVQRAIQDVEQLTTDPQVSDFDTAQKIDPRAKSQVDALIVSSSSRDTRKVAEQGFAKAQCDLGRMYYMGQGVPIDYAKALYWWRKAAEQGYARAQYELAGMYYNGECVPQDYTRALYWYRKAAKQGHVEAQFVLGWKHEIGDGIPQDYTRALYWYRKAAEQGHAGAQFILGWKYEIGKGVPQDYTKAVNWYRKAAEQEYADAQFVLGRMYDNGKGVMQNNAVAADWFYRAGLSYLRGNRKDDASECVEMIKKLGNIHNAFLANELLATIHSD